MPRFHNKFMILRDQLGYHQAGPRGACAHYAEKAIDAWLAEPDGYKTFLKRRALIDAQYASLQNQIATVRHKIKKIKNYKPIPEEQDVLDVAAFMDGHLYQTPEQYGEVFGKTLYQAQAAHTISLFAQPKALEQQGGRAWLASYSNIYTREELTAYFALLHEAAQRAAEDFALSLAGKNHRIALCYRAKTATWTLVNISHAVPAQYENLSHDTLTAPILQEFEGNPQAFNTGFDTAIYCRGDIRYKLQRIIDNFVLSKAFQAIHEVTPERGLAKTASNITLAWLAAKKRVRSTLAKLAKLAKVTGNKDYLNVRDKNNGATPVYLAVQGSDVDCLKILIDAKADLNIPNKRGSRPIMIAVQHNFLDCLQMLIDAGADIHTPRSDHTTPAFIAIHYGHVEALKILLAHGASLEGNYRGKPFIEFAVHPEMQEFLQDWLNTYHAPVFWV